MPWIASNPYQQCGRCLMSPLCQKRTWPVQDLSKDLQLISLTLCVAKLAEGFVVEDYVKPAVLGRFRSHLLLWPYAQSITDQVILWSQENRMHLNPGECSLFQALMDSGGTHERKRHAKSWRGGKKERSFLPFYFRVCGFSIQRTRLFWSLEQARENVKSHDFVCS